MIHVRVQIYCAVGEVCATLSVLVLCQFFHILCIHSSIAILSDVQVVCTVSEHWLLLNVRTYDPACSLTSFTHVNVELQKDASI